MNIAVQHQPTGYNGTQVLPLLLVGRKQVMIGRIALDYWGNEGERVDHRYSNSRKGARLYSIKALLPDTVVLSKDNLTLLTSYRNLYSGGRK
jgi:hypothetical protein